MPLEPGDDAPDFTLLDQRGEPFTLSTSLEQRKAPHLVYFYSKADTPGCTAQACGLRDVLADRDDVVVAGVSPDLPSRLAAFDDRHGLGFALLSDPEHVTADAYGTWGEKKLYGRTYEGVIRSAFLVDEAGRVAQAWYKITPKDTPKKLLAALGRP